MYVCLHLWHRAVLYQKQLRPGPELIQVSKTLFFGLNKLRCGSVAAIDKGHVVVYRWLKGLLLINFLVPQNEEFPQITTIIKLDLFQSILYAFVYLFFLALTFSSDLLYTSSKTNCITKMARFLFNVYFPIVHWAVFFIRQKYININC